MFSLRNQQIKNSKDWKQKHWLWDWSGQLTQMYICTVNNRIEAQKYQESKKAQENLRSALPQSLIDALNKRAIDHTKRKVFIKIKFLQ
jgi:hypothetical protein